MKFLARVFTRDLIELSRSSGMLLLLFVVPLLLLFLVGNLKVREPSIRMAILTDDVPEVQLARLQSARMELSRVELADPEQWKSGDGDLRQRAVRSHVDLVALWVDENWQFYTPLTNHYRLQFARGIAQNLTLSMQRHARQDEQLRSLDALGQLLRAAPETTNNSQAAEMVGDMVKQSKAEAAMPTPLLGAWLDKQLMLFYPPTSLIDRSLVPGFIALIAVFLPFLLASGALVREREAGTLETLVITARRDWTRLVAGKLLMPIFASMLATLLLLIAARVAFGFGIKPGLFIALGFQLLAATVSAVLGLGVSTTLATSRDAYTASSVYLVACILITGLIYPVEQAAWGVIGVSYAFPLTLSGPPLEEWMLKGAGALVEPWRLGGLVAQLASALVICGFAVRRLRHGL